MTTTTQQGVAQAAPSFTEEDAANEFLSRWSDEDPEKASQTPEDEDDTPEQDEAESGEADEGTEVEADESEEDPQEGDEESTEDGDDDEDGEEPAPKEKQKGKVLDDDKVVKIKVDDEELEVSVKDLKRLYGQEAALTKKSQQVAERRKELEDANTRAAAQLDRLHQKARARWEPYSKIDMLVASKSLDNEQFAALRAEAQAAYDDYRFITQEVDSFVKTANEQRQQQRKAEAADAVTHLTKTIPGWNQKVYDDVRTYAIGFGMPAEMVNNLTDPHAIQIIHKAMLHDKAKTIVTKKVNNTPKKVLKTSTPTTVKSTKVDKSQKALKALKSSGSTEDAANVFLARWANQ